MPCFQARCPHVVLPRLDYDRIVLIHINVNKGYILVSCLGIRVYILEVNYIWKNV